MAFDDQANMSRFRKSALWTAALWICPAPAFAHGSARGMVMLLPTGYYQVAAALAVAASFAVLLGAPARRLRWLEARSAPLFYLRARPPRWPSWLSFALLCALLLSGYAGNPDPLANPLPLSVWTLWWVGFTVLQGAAGNLWPLLNPWSGPLTALRRLCPRLRVAPFNPPRALGYAPAFVLFLAFAWFELVDPAPDNPGRLARAVLLYWCATFAACLLFGERDWFRRAEPFAIFFRLIGACSPLLREPRRHRRRGARLAFRLCLPGAQLAALPPLPLSGVCFVLLTLSSVSFDGLNKTFAYLSQLGINPLAFPGRSAVVAGNSAGLLLAFAALAALFFGCVWSGCRLLQNPGAPGILRRSSGRLIYSLLPISLVFHLAHYLTALLTNAQYALRAFNDPFHLNWSVLGAENYRVTTSFTTHLPSVSMIWSAQTGFIVLGHVIGITVAHLMAARLFGDSRAAGISQLPLAGLMVFYTWFGLWLLSTPAVG
ncbi:MAG: hypothetical protein OXU96_04350 [Gammaproteobacteria bacterium]|nr:hypothetical protein [Gammaproteobacteria bacterium]MDD9874350.1 hypothetical protein [Gammaproteobacteria bacterium]